ncbi:MAG TPA: GNAT family protein [Solirubrobacteraceae bacterium]|nr:GNAT family protein [Solirubrobacteraceae bacterium]
MLPALRGGRVALRALREDDVDWLSGVIAQPEIARWWGPRAHDREHMRVGLLEDVAAGAAFAIEVDGALAGWLGVEEEEEPDYRHASLDIFLAPALHGAGHGSAALRLAARWLLGERGHHRLTIDPAAANERAIGVYASLGFKPVGIMREYERGPDDEWRDGLLMDLLADELT